MSRDLVIHRRRARGRPMRLRRFGAALQGGAPGGGPAVPFPGIRFPEPEGARRSLVSGSVALLVHAGAVALLFLFAWLAPQELKEELIPVALLREPPAPRTDPAPARKALAERRSVRFLENAQAVQPQVVNPKVVARAVPQVAASKLEMNAVSQVVAPRQVTRQAVVVEKVTAVRSSAAATAGVVEVTSPAGPVLRGPAQVQAPVGVEVGPRQIVRAGEGVGTGSAVLLGDGSSVREGVLSDRDVLGSPSGPRLASVNTAVGTGYLHGSGGTGAGGVRLEDCEKRPEVQRYFADMHRRVYSRWVTPPGVDPNQEVVLRFTLDVAGTASGVQFVSGGDRSLGAVAVDAVRSASPFPALPDGARCLAGVPILATFRNPLDTPSTPVAN